MAGTLTVQNIQGPSSGANANKIIIPAGQTLDASGATLRPSDGVVQFKQLYNSDTEVSYSQSGVQLGTRSFWYPAANRIGGSFTKLYDASTSYVITGGHYYNWASSNLHDFWVWRDGDENNGIHLGDDIYALSAYTRRQAKVTIDAVFTNVPAGTHTFYCAAGAGDTRTHTGVLNRNPYNTSTDMSNQSTRTAMWAMEVML